MNKKSLILLCGICACGLIFHYALSIDIVSVILIAICAVFYTFYLFGLCLKWFSSEYNIGVLFKIQCLVIVVFLIGNLMTFLRMPYFKIVSRVGLFGSYILIWYIICKRVLLAIYSKVKNKDCNKNRARDWNSVLRLYLVLLMCVWLRPYYNYAYSAQYSNGHLIYLKEVDGFHKKEVVNDKGTYTLMYEKIEDINYSRVTRVDSVGEYHTIEQRGDSTFKIIYSDYPNVERVDTLFK